MRLATVHDPIQSCNLGESNTFSIAASAKAFEILSSNLYQNKILAVIREISCNAADAHTSVGKPFNSIQVHLPTYGEPWFSVRDFGPGLSHNDVMQLYTTYFQSTKDNSDDLIGGFGLGSKSPFAVTDQFTVTSWHNGTKSEYVMYKDAGLPRVNVIRSVSSSEPSGILVQVGVDKNFPAWVNEACNFFRWWSVRPTITPSNVVVPDYPISKEINSKSPTLNANGDPLWLLTTIPQPTALVGLVPYAIDFSAIPNNPYPGINLPLLFVFDIGEVSINPSRETLSYDPKTCATIIARLNFFFSEYLQTFQDELAAAPTLYDARVLRWVKWAKMLGSISNIEQKFNWKNKTITSEVFLDFTDAPLDKYNCKIIKKHWRKNIWRRYSRIDKNISNFLSQYTQELDKILYVWSEKLTTKTYKAIEHGVATNYPNANEVVIIYGNNSDFATISKAAEEAGFPPIHDVTNWPVPAAQPSTKSKTPIAKGYKYNFANSAWERDLNDVDLKGGGLYVEFFNGNPTKLLREFATARAAKFVDTPNRFIGFRRAQLQSQKFKDDLVANGWVAYDDAWWSNNVPADKLEEYAYTRALQENFDNNWNQRSKIEALIAGFKKLPNLQLASSANVITILMQDFKHVNVISINTLTSLCSSDAHKQAMLRAVTRANQVKAAWKAFLAAHPLCAALEWTNPSLDFQAVADYINR